MYSLSQISWSGYQTANPTKRRKQNGEITKWRHDKTANIQNGESYKTANLTKQRIYKTANITKQRIQKNL